MNMWRITYVPSERTREMLGIAADDDRARTEEAPLWRLAIVEATDLARNGWAESKPRITAVRP